MSKLLITVQVNIPLCNEAFERLSRGTLINEKE